MDMLIRKNRVFQSLILFLIGGFLYGVIEIVYRGYSHISMFLAGGACFVLIGIMNRTVPKKTGLLVRGILSALLITEVEFFVGIVVNRWMKLDVWDYSALPLNIMGQICLYYIGIWFALSLLAIPIYDYIKYLIVREEKPRYRLL